MVGVCGFVVRFRQGAAAIGAKFKSSFGGDAGSREPKRPGPKMERKNWPNEARHRLQRPPRGKEAGPRAPSPPLNTPSSPGDLHLKKKNITFLFSFTLGLCGIGCPAGQIGRAVAVCLASPSPGRFYAPCQHPSELAQLALSTREDLADWVTCSISPQVVQIRPGHEANSAKMR